MLTSPNPAIALAGECAAVARTQAIIAFSAVTYSHRSGCSNYKTLSRFWRPRSNEIVPMCVLQLLNEV